ncbi:glutathione S-transferase N-terminal domain-containing protein [Patescibacteria group bacterium]|nr:glutathione S-transferase N-terminal domain-containing protein [Patescibacteria group bacterium]
MTSQGKTHSVTVFSTPTCPWCTRAKQYLTQMNIPFKDVNVAVDQKSAMEMIRKSGQMGVPQLWIDDAVVVGFDQGRINHLLGIPANTL